VAGPQDILSLGTVGVRQSIKSNLKDLAGAHRIAITN
jgi:hypothetical protein